MLVVFVEQDSALYTLLQVLGGRGSSFWTDEKGGDDLSPLQKLSKGELIPHLIHVPSPPTPDRHPAPLRDYCESAREPAGGIFPLDALVFPSHLEICLQGAGLNLI